MAEIENQREGGQRSGKSEDTTAAKFASGEASLKTIAAAAPNDAPEETPSR